MKGPRPRTASFIATPEGVVFHNEDSDTSSEYPPSDSDDMVSTQEHDLDTTSEHFSPTDSAEEGGNVGSLAEPTQGTRRSNSQQGLQTHLNKLVQQLLMLDPYLDGDYHGSPNLFSTS